MHKLHSLNALRMGAEFLVVHFHIALHLPGPLFTSDLMSFFFVLSGFVVAHTHPEGPDSGFLRRRLSKVLIPLWVSVLADTYGAWKTQYIEGCGLFWPGYVLNFLLLSPWTGHYPYSHPNGVAWYLLCLIWLWLFFSITPSFTILKKWPWSSIMVLYVVSQGMFLLATPLLDDTKRMIPLLRLPEFYMGYCAAHAKRGFPVLAVLLFVGLVTFHWVMPMQPVAHKSPCQLFVTVNRPFGPVEMLGKSSIVWAVLIQAVAKYEMDGGLTWASHPFLVDLNKISLHVYLFHTLLAAVAGHIMDGVGVPFSTAWAMMFAYCGSWVVVQLEERARCVLARIWLLFLESIRTPKHPGVHEQPDDFATKEAYEGNGSA